MSELLMQYKQKNIAPRKLGLVKLIPNKNKEHELKLDNQKLDNNYLNLLGDIIGKRNDYRYLHLSKNNLSPESAKTFFNKFSQNPNRLDVSYNSIGLEGLNSICQMLSNQKSKTKLLDLNLEGNNLKCTDILVNISL